MITDALMRLANGLDVNTQNDTAFDYIGDSIVFKAPGYISGKQTCLAMYFADINAGFADNETMQIHINIGTGVDNGGNINAGVVSVAEFKITGAQMRKHPRIIHKFDRIPPLEFQNTGAAEGHNYTKYWMQLSRAWEAAGGALSPAFKMSAAIVEGADTYVYYRMAFIDSNRIGQVPLRDPAEYTGDFPPGKAAVNIQSV